MTPLSAVASAARVLVKRNAVPARGQLWPAGVVGVELHLLRADEVPTGADV
jgi:hypothetical protein